MSQSKKVQNKASKKSNTLMILAISIVVLIAAFIFISNNFSDNSSTGGNNAVVKDSDIVIQTSEISEKARFYPAEINGTELEVLAVKASDGTVRTAFNTCQVCYSSGRGYYVQEGNVLVCQNCGNRFGMDDVEVTRGGCNPVPITSEEKTVTDTSITISKEYLTEATVIFKNWKS